MQWPLKEKNVVCVCVCVTTAGSVNLVSITCILVS